MHEVQARFSVTSSHIVAAMVAVVSVLGAVAWWDQRSQAQSALADFGVEQAMIARAATNGLAEALSVPPSVNEEAVLREAAMRLRALEQPDNLVVLVRPPGAQCLLTLTGRCLRCPSVEARLAEPSPDGAWVRLSHPEAQALGLPPRTAIAGVSEIDRGEDRWDLIIATSAQRERDREERGLWRIGLGFVIASTVVVTFGILALRRQRTELDLAKRLAVAEAVQARDDRLVKADKLASLGALAMGIAHQVATPLAVIVARAERLEPRLAHDERSRKAVAIISEQAQRINQVVRSFLDLARGGSPTLVHTDPGDVGQMALELIAHRIEKAGVVATLRVEPDLPRFACDPRLFEQVIVNLLLNACDACDEGGHIALDIRLLEGSIAFIVEDDGHGLTTEEASRATEPFFTTKPPAEGSGLGLAIAREIVQHHRGRLTIEPRSVRGTRACVTVPADGSAGDDKKEDRT
jgi:two-component system, NtrC family, sensor kinase